MGKAMGKLNPYRVSDWTTAMMNAYTSRMHGNLKGAARWLATAGVIRAEAWKPWDYETEEWVCLCCMLMLANGECCADDTHGGDKVVPLNKVKPEDSWSLGGEHVEGCDREDCGCERAAFSRLDCDGCGSTLHGERYLVTVFVNDRRNQPVEKVAA